MLDSSSTTTNNKPGKATTAGQIDKNARERDKFIITNQRM